VAFKRVTADAIRIDEMNETEDPPSFF
jgi:hypothetical protein